LNKTEFYKYVSLA